MREIKFRAWDGRKMQDWDFIRHIYELSFLNNGKVMQYTGLKDKNGKEIYEGDIVKNIVKYPVDYEIKFGDILGSVNFKDGGYFVGEHFVLTESRSKEIEVIGNIYENPKLLKK